MQVSQEDVEFYQKNGAVVIRKLFSPAHLSLLEAGIARNMAEPSPLSIVASRLWRTRREPDFGVPPDTTDLGPDDTEGDYLPEGPERLPLDPTAASAERA